MNVAQDFSITRDIKLGSLIFLQSEMYRHQKDIDDIKKIIKEMVEELEVTTEERDLIDIMAQRDREF